VILPDASRGRANQYPRLTVAKPLESLDSSSWWVERANMCRQAALDAQSEEISKRMLDFADIYENLSKRDETWMGTMTEPDYTPSTLEDAPLFSWSSRHSHHEAVSDAGKSKGLSRT